MRFALIAALVILATLIRETAGILVCLSVIAVMPRLWRQWLGLLVCFVATFAFLRLSIQTPPTVFTIPYVWQLNMEWFRLSGAILYIPILALLLAVVIRRTDKHLLYRIAVVLAPYLLLVAVFGVWREVRLLMPIFIFAIPLMKRVE